MRRVFVLGALLLALAAPRASRASELGSVLVLCADCVDAGCVVSSYGAGFIVGIDETNGAAHVLTARHVVAGFDRVYVLYDPTTFPLEYVGALESGSVPPVLANALADRGLPRPTAVRSSRVAGDGVTGGSGPLILQAASWLLVGAGREYLALRGDSSLHLFLVLPARVAEESDAALDVALLTVDDFPLDGRDPVLYMDTPSEVRVGAGVTTVGCQCGMTQGVSQSEALGTAVLSDPGFLSYESDSVSPGFSGGPVFMGKHVVAMNLTQDLRTGSRIRARLASGFKGLVDGWIGLRRMKVDLVIGSPEGARDGTVSEDQSFTVRASARLDPQGQVLAPTAAIRLDLPDEYRTDGEVVGVLDLGEEMSWTVLSPKHVADPLSMTLHGSDASPESDLVPLAEVLVATEAAVHLKGVLEECPRDGSTIFRDDEFPVTLRFAQTGRSLTDMVGSVTLDVARHQFAVQGAQDARSIALDAPLTWRLTALEGSARAPISFRVSLRCLDGNGRAIHMELPETITLRVKEEPGFQFYAGIGRLSLEGTSGDSEGQEALGKRSEGESKGELELGTKFLISNVMQRGIPLYVTLAVGMGLDDTWDKSLESRGGEYGIADWRAWGGLGLSLGLGPVHASVDAGYIRLDRWIDGTAPDELSDLYAEQGVSSAFIRPGIELALAPAFSFYAAARTMPELDDTEFYLQIRVRTAR